MLTVILIHFSLFVGLVLFFEYQKHKTKKNE